MNIQAKSTITLAMVRPIIELKSYQIYQIRKTIVKIMNELIDINISCQPFFNEDNNTLPCTVAEFSVEVFI